MGVTWFDESRLDDESVAGGSPTSGCGRWPSPGRAYAARPASPSAAIEEAVTRAVEQGRPRTVIAAGPDSRLLRAVLEPWCPVPFVAWPGPALPGWAGSLDLVVVLAPDGSDTGTASAVAEAVRRGCQVVVACPPQSLVAEHAAGRWSTIFPTVTRDQLATAVVMLSYLDRVPLGPAADAEQVAEALDDVAISCSPHRDIAVNPAKMLAIALADANPLVWGGTVLAARAARRVAESIRRASGRTALAGDAEHLLPVIEAARPRDVFDDPFADGKPEPRPMLRAPRRRRGGAGRPRASGPVAGGSLLARCTRREREHRRTVARWRATPRCCSRGTYAAEYLRLGLVEE